MANNVVPSVVILAAGRGTRMHSDIPKVLHTLIGKPMLQYVIDTAIKLNPRHINVVYGNRGELLKEQFTSAALPLNWVYQPVQRGTAHAVQQAIPHFADDEAILILYGDVPLISITTLQALIEEKIKNDVVLLTAHQNDPHGYGRILRQNNSIVGIVEQKDADAEQQKIKEIHSGIMITNSHDLKRWLAMLNSNNSQNELYLTDIISLAYIEGKRISSISTTDLNEICGVNNLFELMQLERLLQHKKAKALLLAGVTVRDPQRLELRGNLIHGRDIIVDINVIIEGNVQLGNRVHIGAGVILKNCNIGDDCKIHPYSILENTTLKTGCSVGPFARLRPGSILDEGVYIGNFVEIKQAHLGKATKAGHLAYLGNATIGDDVNIGAGAITCNYDGANKHQTVIGNNVFIGSNAQLIAPVTIAKGATIGAGTTVTNNVGEQQLALSRKKQHNINGWQRPIKKK